MSLFFYKNTKKLYNDLHVGGSRLLITDGRRNLVLKTKAEREQLELRAIEISSNMYAGEEYDWTEIGNALYRPSQVNGTLTITDEQYDMLMKPIGTVDPIDDTKFMVYTTINPLPPGPIIVTDLDHLFSLLISSDYPSFCRLHLSAGYFLPIISLIDKKLSEFKSYGLNEPRYMFNSEKKKIKADFKILNEIFVSFETIFINKLILDQSKSYGHKNTGILTLYGTQYFYKDHLSTSLFTFDISQIYKTYKFVLECSQMNIDQKYTYTNSIGTHTYDIHFVTVPLNLIFSIKNNGFVMGYLMEIVDGETIQNIRINSPEYFQTHKDLIREALYSLVDRLTEKKFFITDLMDDNVMWNTSTNTLTFIDIDPNSFGRTNDENINIDTMNPLWRNQINIFTA